DLPSHWVWHPVHRWLLGLRRQGTARPIIGSFDSRWILLGGSVDPGSIANLTTDFMPCYRPRVGPRGNRVHRFPAEVDQAVLRRWRQRPENPDAAERLLECAV